MQNFAFLFALKLDILTNVIVQHWFSNNAAATREALKYIPKGGYPKFLNENRLGIVHGHLLFGFSNDSEILKAFENHFHISRSLNTNPP